jgi:hypothetical protein
VKQGGNDVSVDIEAAIREIADRHTALVNTSVERQLHEMKQEQNDHRMIYNMMGVSEKECALIDEVMVKGRFMMVYAGKFIEEAAVACFASKYPGSTAHVIKNTINDGAKKIEIDCLVQNRDAFEIKWRGGVTDGDSVRKELMRMECIRDAGYKPMRLTFFPSQRDRPQKIYRQLEARCNDLGGECYAGEDAWVFMKDYTDVDLRAIISKNNCWSGKTLRRIVMDNFWN